MYLTENELLYYTTLQSTCRSLTFGICQHGMFWHCWRNFASFALMCGSKDIPLYLMGGELKVKSRFGRYLDGWVWIWEPIKGLRA